jgi:parallel beta-helix repeat protein
MRVRTQNPVVSELVSMLIGSLMICIIAIPSLARAATIMVPADYPTIQAAVAAAIVGDTVLVQPGIYAESVRVEAGRHGLTIAAADDRNPPILIGEGGASGPGIVIDRADDVTIRNIVVRGGAEGVRVEHALDTMLRGLRLEGNGVGIYFLRGGRHTVVASEILGTLSGEAIRVQRSPEVVVRNVVIDGAGRDGILVDRSRHVTIDNATVTNVQGRHGIMMIASPASTIANCTVRRSRLDGIRIRRSPELTLRRNDADDNGMVGVRIHRSFPFGSVQDVMAAGNEAIGNGLRDVVVTGRPCRRRRCGTTTTTRPAGATTTTVTSTLPPMTSLSTTTTVVVPTTLPIRVHYWRLYIRIARTNGTPHDVNVPFRSSDMALIIDIPAPALSTFREGDQVTGAEIQALGGDTLARLENAAAAYISSHLGDYPGFAGIDEIRWASRVSSPV